MVFTWDCSSIGQSTALSRRKLRVRAPSVPTDPIKKYINSALYFLWKIFGVKLSRISFPRAISLLFFFFSHLSSMGEFPFLWLVLIRLMGDRHMWICTIIGSIRFRIPRDTIPYCTGYGFFDYFRSVE